jgi:hypothetical protein
MKKTYMKPEMQVHQILHRGMLLTSGNGKGVYGKVKVGDVEQRLEYGGYVTQEDEDEFDPD